MYPYLFPETLGYNFPLYDIMIVIGIFFMLAYVAKRFEKREGFTRKQTNSLLILIVISLVSALVFSYLFDGVFHSIAEGELTFGSITFLGGLVGGLITFVLLYKYFYKEENKDIMKVLNTFIAGVVLAHAFGRIGCFFAGCCYGVPTESFLGVVFPYGHAAEAYPGLAVYPTQLFESAFLFVLFFLLDGVKSFRNMQFFIYLIGYGTFRFLIEFIRGDNRGAVFTIIETQYNTFPTPSQLISLGMIVLGVVWLLKQTQKNQNIEAGN